MENWKTCTIADLGTVVGGATPSTKKPENYEGGTIAWITPKDLAGFSGRFISHGERNITEAGLNSCSARMMLNTQFFFHQEHRLDMLRLLRMKFVQIRASKV